MKMIRMSRRRCESMPGWNIRQQRDPQHSAHIRNPFHSSCTLYFNSNCTPLTVWYIHYTYTSTFCTVQNKHTLPIYFVLYNTTSLSIKTLILHCSALFWIVKQCPASQRCCVCFSSSSWLHLGSWNESKAICWSNLSNIKESILCDDRHLR